MLIVVAQVYPVIDANSDSVRFWKLLSQQGLYLLLKRGFRSRFSQRRGERTGAEQELGCA
jgi:hypothetical protein